MPNDEERLIVSLEARITDFERRMKQAEGTGTRSYKALTAGSSRATGKMEQDMIRSTTRINQALAQTSSKIGSFGKAMIGGFAVGAAVGALEGIRQAAEDSTKSILEMADQAKMAGVSFKAFQGLKFVAEQNRIGIDALTDGLKELSLRADEFIQTGSGSGAEAFQRLGYSAEDLTNKLKKPDQLFLEIIGRLESFDKASQIRIADEVFGGSGGEKFVQLISQGEQGLRQQIKAAEDLGIVMDENMIRKAEEVNQKFNLITTTISTKLKQAIVDAVSAWFEFLDSYNEFQDQKNGTLQSRQTAIMAEKNRIAAARQDAIDNKNLPERSRNRAVSTFDEQLRKLNEEEDQIIGVLSQRVERTRSKFVPPTPPPGGFASSSSGGKVDLTRYLAAGKDASHIAGMSSSFEGKLEKLFQALPKELAGQLTIKSGFRSVERQQQLWQDALAKYGSVAEARKWVAPPGNSQHNKGNAADLGFGSDTARQWAHDNASKFGLSFPLNNENWHIEDSTARGKDMDARTQNLEQKGKAYDDMIEKARQMIASDNLEAQALGMTKEAAAKLRYEQELLNEAKQAGITLNPTQIENIKQLASEMAAAEAQTRKLATSQQDLQRQAEEFGSAARNVIGGFVSDLAHGASASDALKSALGRLADQLLNGAFDTLFGGGDVKGGGVFGKLFSSFFKIGANANGTESWRGGPTWVGENGPEIINAPARSQIVPNHRLHLAAQAPRSETKVEKPELHVHVNGGSGDQHIRELARQGAQEALHQDRIDQARGSFGTMQKKFNARVG